MTFLPAFEAPWQVEMIYTPHLPPGCCASCPIFLNFTQAGFLLI